MLLCRDLPVLPTLPAMPVGPRAGGIALVLFLVMLVALPIAGEVAPGSLLAVASIFYQAGALVFGGGHVVLPLLRDALVPSGWLPDDVFLAGYGATQAMPGLLFAFSAYLGAAVAPSGSAALWSAVALMFMFLPGTLVALAGVPLWTWLAHRPAAKAGLAGVNATVVGVLSAALYDPIWTSAIQGPGRGDRSSGFSIAGTLASLATCRRGLLCDRGARLGGSTINCTIG